MWKQLLAIKHERERKREREGGEQNRDWDKESKRVNFFNNFVNHLTLMSIKLSLHILPRQTVPEQTTYPEPVVEEELIEFYIS